MISSCNSYNPNSPVLIITLDAYHKIREGEHPEYNSGSSIISSRIDDSCKMLISVTRQKIFRYLKSGSVTWKDSNKERDYNDNLLLAKDFQTDNNDAMYLPALYRYDGDFYDGLGEKGKDYLLHSRHHFLILSGLYGFLMPFEDIQFYSCQFGDKNICFNLWTDQNRISKVLVNYIRKYKISKIFDFTACDVTAYHEAIDWDFVSKDTPADVLHAYHLKTTTDKGLKYFGRFVQKHMLLSDTEALLQIKNGSIIDEIEFSEGVKRIVAVPEISNQIITDWITVIKSRERKNIEFKQSLRWSFSSSEDKKNSEYIAMRAISSMLNSEGGFLFIGVGDDGSVIGIENDYKTLKKQNSDDFLLNFDNLINIYLGKEFHQYISVSIEKVENKDICVVQIAKSEIPSFLKSKKDGVIKEEFFIRGAASSQPLSMKETLNYIQNHWKK